MKNGLIIYEKKVIQKIITGGINIKKSDIKNALRRKYSWAVIPYMFFYLEDKNIKRSSNDLE